MTESKRVVAVLRGACLLATLTVAGCGDGSGPGAVAGDPVARDGEAKPGIGTRHVHAVRAPVLAKTSFTGRNT